MSHRGSEKRTLVDTGPLVALRNKRDQHRNRVHELARQLPGRLFTCWPVLTEAVYLLREHPQEIDVLLSGFMAGNLSLLRLEDRDVPAIAAIMSKYADQSFSLADASLKVYLSLWNNGLSFLLQASLARK